MTNIKVLRKRIALTAAAALGVGVLIAAPASAAAIPSSAVGSLNLTAYTAAPTVGASVVVNAGATTISTAVTVGDTARFTGYLSSYPAGGFAQVSAKITTGGAGTDTGGAVTSIANAATTAATGATLTASASASPVGGNTITSSASNGFGSFGFTPSVAGTYILTVWNDANTDGIVNIGEAVQTISVSVASATVYPYSPALSTAIVNSGASTGALTDAIISAPKTVGTQVANVAITLKRTNGLAINGETVSATISGPGLIKFGAVAATAGTVRADSSGVLSGNTTFLGINSDGTAGVGSVTISVTDATSGVTSVLATKTFTFYGGVASLTVTQRDFVIGLNGAVAGTNSGSADNSTWALTPAVVVKALDSNGNIVTGAAASISGLSSDTTVIQSVSAVNEDTNGANGGAGYYNSAITSALASTSGRSATVTFRYTPDAGSTYIYAPALTFTTGGTPATVTFGLDAATYAPGAKATLTITAKDSAGNSVADGTYPALFTAAGVTSSAAIQGTLPGPAVRTSKGVATGTFYVPISSVFFTISGTLGTSVATAVQGTVVSASASVAGPVDTSTAGQIAAANAAIASLATTVATMYASLSYQIRVLNVLIKRIMKRFNIH